METVPPTTEDPSVGQEAMTKAGNAGKVASLPEPLILNLSNRTHNDGCVVGEVVALSEGSHRC